MSSIPGAGRGAAELGDDARSVLRNDGFRNLLLGSVTSSMGDWIGLFALIALAETLEGATRAGALAVTFVMLARVVPTLVFAPVAGVFVDRWNRKRALIVTDVVRGAIMLLVPFVGDAFQLVIATFVIEIASALFIPAKDAVVPTIVPREQLVSANQLSLVSTYATLPVGALVCALLISGTEAVASPDTFLADRPEAVPILVNALSFFVSMLFIQRVDVPTDNVRRVGRDSSTSAVGQLRDGLRFIAGMPLIRALVIGVMTAFFAAGVVIGVGEFFATILNAGEAGFALLGFVVGSGLVAGIATVRWADRRVAKERLFAPGIGAAGVLLVVAALMPSLALAAIPVLLMGVGAGMSFVTGYTMLQEHSTDEVRGRTFATFNTAVRLALFAALVVGPAMVIVLGVERTEAEIAAGTEVADLDELGPAEDSRYPYQIGGVRFTLISAGLVAAAGAGWSGWQISRALRRLREEEGGALATDVDEFVRARPGHSGLLVVFEGGDGAGKSTQASLLAAAVRRAGYECVITREPGGTPLGEGVRDLVLSPRYEVGPRSEALLYAAARAQHVDEVLRPALERGAIVISDRYVDSSIVYQGEGRELGADVVAELNSWATAGLRPDLVVLLDVDAGTGLGRVASSGSGVDRLEAAGGAFHDAVNAAFRARAAADPDRYVVLDATGSVEEVQRGVRARVRELLARDHPDVRLPPTPSPATTAEDG